eukprot:TRINITY_DN10384_c0_g1_i1.p1 TRINITY_DN10384_c0_g1~~TRINITY_DN10384_c0_g1_i1.p1  ORF type:complete len:805 (+),score=210.62 TRINITY_DN10384_c0_g1_i1:64-2478(+)
MSVRRESSYSDAEVQARFREIYELKLQLVSLEQKFEAQSKVVAEYEATNQLLHQQLERAKEEAVSLKREVETANAKSDKASDGVEVHPLPEVASMTIASRLAHQASVKSLDVKSEKSGNSESSAPVNPEKEKLKSLFEKQGFDFSRVFTDSVLNLSTEPKRKDSVQKMRESVSALSETVSTSEYQALTQPSEAFLGIEHSDMVKMVLSLKDQIEDLTLTLRATNEELEEVKKKLDQSKLETQNYQAAGIKIERLNQQLEIKVDEMNIIVQSLRTENQNLKRILETTAQDEKMTMNLKEEVARSRVTIDQLRKHIVALSSDANKKYGDLQNQLETGRMFIEQLKQEYEEFVKVSMIEQDTIRNHYVQEYNRLREDFDAFKRTQFEEKRQLIQEQQTLLFAMQSQFDEYRMTAEFLFNTEASKLEEKLNIQMMKYDQEIRYVIRSKDRLFDEMIAAKDVKIMMLIEGSDTQVLTQKHATEMDTLKKSHLRDIQELKKQHARDLQVSLGQMNQELVSLQKTIESLRGSLSNSEKRVEEMREKIGQKNKKLHQSELAAHETQSRLNKQIDALQTRNDILIQEKEQLRHRLIRMKTDRVAIGDNSMETLLKHLTQEVSRLTTESTRLSNRCAILEEEKEDISKKEESCRHQLILTEHRFENMKQEMQRMTDAFEAMVNSKLRKFAKKDDQYTQGQRSLLLPKIDPRDTYLTTAGSHARDRAWNEDPTLLATDTKSLLSDAIVNPAQPPSQPSIISTKSPRIRHATHSAPNLVSKMDTGDLDFQEELITAMDYVRSFKKSTRAAQRNAAH